ncbi:MAG: MerR family transcriptional regulator [Moraxellaceae bacterium]|nr:MerR family transcriptional regulator [Moraxellaceae bacterium]MDZ4387121.1 MerR family transcriptional regulator [Moraxellaceae bacterium]
MNAKVSNDDSSTDLAENPVMLPINAVERETGVSKELLRMWERRYGFPNPDRDEQGDRIYDMDQIAKLRLLRRLIDHGFRPGKIINLPVAELERLIRSQGQSQLNIAPELEQELLQLLKDRDVNQIRDYLSHQLIKMGLESFIVEFLQHANFIVGDAWMRGAIEVHEEHLFSEQVQTLVRQAITNLRPAVHPPRVLLATPPEETHTLGILMVEALLRLDGIEAISYGAQMPVRDITAATAKNKIDIVAMSFSASYPTSKAIEYLEELRFKLPLTVEIWGGGAALRSTRRSVEAVQFIQDLPSIRQAAAIWRRAHGIY